MRYIGLICLIFIFNSCAIQVPPAGGEKDTKPPKVLSTTPENYSTNINANNIEIEFDEYVQLKDANTQLIVSPLLNYQPTTKIRKKKLYIHISDTLKANTTYTLNFGTSISDLNEGNLLENYQYIFSTGSILDSLKIKGKVENAFNLKKDKNHLVMLYRNSDDSIPYKERPLYFSKTNGEGEYSINNISPGSYKIIALEDKDGNYLYSKGDELIGFSDSLVSAGKEDVKLRLFKESLPLKLARSQSSGPGQATLIFTAAADTFKLNWLTDFSKLDFYSQVFSIEKDTLTIWYKNTESDSLSFYYNNGGKNDTVDVRLFKRKNENSRNKFSLESQTIDANSNHNFSEPYQIEWSHPISKVEREKFILKEDSVPISKIDLFFSDSLKTKLNVNHKWKQKSQYELTILPGGLVDIFGLKNDTLILKWFSKSEVDYGTMALKFSGRKEASIVQLIDEKENVIRQVRVNRDTVVTFNYLDPMIYRFKLINDKNDNGKWDTGNLINHIQPEEVEYYPELITVRSNWDVEVKWDK